MQKLTCHVFQQQLFQLQDYIDQHFAEGVEETLVSIFSECAI